MHRLRSWKPAAGVCGRAAQINGLFTSSIGQSYAILNTYSERGEPVPGCARAGAALYTGFVEQQARAESKNLAPDTMPRYDYILPPATEQNRVSLGLSGCKI